MTDSKLRIAAAVLGVVAMLGASFLAVRQFADAMLRRDAVEDARVWAENLLANVHDLPQILKGEMPSDESVVFFEQARIIGNIECFKLYGRDGTLEVVSDQIGRTHRFPEAHAIRDSKILARLKAGREVVTTRAGNGPKEPAFLAEATIPIVTQGETIGFMTIIADEAERQAYYVRSAGMLAAGIGILVLIAFAVPAVGYFRRTQQKEIAEDRLQFLAFHDPLTGLKNRRAITDVLDGKLAADASAKDSVAVHFVDLDWFKEINDNFGHDAGDAVLREAAARLAFVAGCEAEVGRVGGDEFLIVQTLHGRAGAAEAMAQRIVVELSKPVDFEKSAFDVGVSVGSAIYRAHAPNSSELLKAADIALYEAKSAGRGCHRLFHPDLNQAYKRRRHVESSIHRALADNGFALHYQPLFNLATGKLEGFEALLRLPEAAGGMISPGEFIPIAEEIGAIVDIGGWVLREGCRSLAAIPPGMNLAINLSPAQFEKGDIVALASDVLAATGADPRRIELEITENFLIKDSKGVRAKVEALKALGFSIALDDFGAGFSSLSYLCQYPFDKIKIDRCFVDGMIGSSSVRTIIETILDLGRKLDIRITAEGVETEEQAAALRAMRCDQVQGYLFGKPMPMNDLLVLVLREVSGERQPKAGRLTSAA